MSSEKRRPRYKCAGRARKGWSRCPAVPGRCGARPAITLISAALLLDPRHRYDSAASRPRGEAVEPSRESVEGRAAVTASVLRGLR